MRNRWICGLALIFCMSGSVSAFAQATTAPDELLKTAKEMVQTTTRLRSLKPKTSIPMGVKDKTEISVFLNEQLREEYDQTKLQKEGRLLQKLGFISAAADYKDLLLKLLTEQIGGFYDLEKKTLFIASWLSAEEQKPVMVHEITHAIQDQYFDFRRVIKENRKQDNDDRALAHQALIEGDAVCVMFESILEPYKRHFWDIPDIATVQKAQLLASQSQFPVLKNSPQFLQDMLLFSYGNGGSFIQQAWKQNPSWEAINKIYSDLPTSTEQILHPEKYFGVRDNPKPVKTDAWVSQLGKNWKIAYQNVLGEFSLGLLLNLHFTEERAKKAATGWGGDQVLLLENEAGKDAVLISTLWDSSSDSEKFYIAMDEWFRRHYPNANRKEESPAGFSIIQDGDYHSLRREGDSVRFVIGLPEADASKLSGF